MAPLPIMPPLLGASQSIGVLTPTLSGTFSQMCFGKIAICTRLSVAKVADGECRWMRSVEGSTISVDLTGA